MAEKKIIELEVKNNLGSLKSQLREAQAEVAKLSEQFGVTSKEAANAARRAAELKDQIEDAKALTDAFNPDAKFKALSSTLGGVASGFAAYQGALGLIGVESKEVEAQLLKVQSAMALAEGLQSLGGLKDSMIALASVVKNQVVTAFATLKGAMMATGIGLVIAAIGTAIYLMDQYNDEIEDNIQKQKRLNEENKKYAEQLGQVAEARQKERNASKGGLNDKERELQLLRARGASEQDIYKKEKEIINKRIFDQNVLLNTFIGNNAAERQKRLEAQENLKNLYAESKSLDASYNRQLRENQQETIKNAQEQREKANEKRLQAEKDFYDNKAKMLEEAENIRLKPINVENQLKKEREREQRKKDLIIQINKETNEELVKDLNKRIEKEEQLEQQAKEQKIRMAGQAFSIIQGVADLFAQGNEEDQRKAFQLNKAVNIGQAIMNTAQGVTAALSGGGNLGKVATGLNFVEAGLIGTIGALNIAKIANTQFQGGGDSGGGGATATPTAPRTPSFDIIQAQPQMQLGALQQQPVKAYVVSGEVSTAQALDRNRVRNATF
jgi:hypothetical protein